MDKNLYGEKNRKNPLKPTSVIDPPGFVLRITEVFNRLRQAGVSIRVDDAGKLIIDANAPEEIKQMVRDHKEELLFYFWSEAKAKMLNQIFKEHGKLGVAGTITGATVRDGAARQGLKSLAVDAAVPHGEDSLDGKESSICQGPRAADAKRKGPSKPRVEVNRAQESLDFLAKTAEGMHESVKQEIADAADQENKERG